MLIKYCSDCNVETECEYCEICNGFVCDECDPAHDCLAEELEAADAELESALDEMIDDDSDDDGDYDA